MNRLIHHWHAPSIDGLAAGTPVTIRSDCGRSLRLTAAKVAEWSRSAPSTEQVPAEDTCPTCLAARGDA